LPDEALRRLRLGGHDPRKVYAAYKTAVEHKGGPTVILARTIKGYGLGEAAKERTSRTSRRIERRRIEGVSFAIWNSAERSGLY